MSRPLPILFVHGFNGDPGDWTDGGFWHYLVRHGGLTPAWYASSATASPRMAHTTTAATCARSHPGWPASG